MNNEQVRAAAPADLSKRLRAAAKTPAAIMYLYGQIMSQAADEIDRLSAPAREVQGGGTVELPPLPEAHLKRGEGLTPHYTKKQMRVFAAEAVAAAVATSAAPERSGKLADDEPAAQPAGIELKSEYYFRYSRMMNCYRTGSPLHAEARKQEILDYILAHATLVATEADSSSAAPSEALPVELAGIAEQVADNAGFWHTCSGCHDTEDGHPTGNYHYSHAFNCPIGTGCSECGGLGACWDNNDYGEEALATPRQTEDGSGLSAALNQMRAAFHVNMLRAFPDKSHAEISAEIDRACDLAPKEPAAQGGVPEGWKLVPVEPTQEMFAAARTSASGSNTEKLLMNSYWRNMLSAAPRPTASAGELPGNWKLVMDEVARATVKFPTWPTDPLHAVAVLGEEFGELTKAVLQTTYEPHKVKDGELRMEAIQTAAMSLRFLASLDRYEFTKCDQHAQSAASPAPGAAK